MLKITAATASQSIYRYNDFSLSKASSTSLDRALCSANINHLHHVSNFNYRTEFCISRKRWFQFWGSLKVSETPKYVRLEMFSIDPSYSIGYPIDTIFHVPNRVHSKRIRSRKIRMDAFTEQYAACTDGVRISIFSHQIIAKPSNLAWGIENKSNNTMEFMPNKAPEQIFRLNWE